MYKFQSVRILWRGRERVHMLLQVLVASYVQISICPNTPAGQRESTYDATGIGGIICTNFNLSEYSGGAERVHMMLQVLVASYVRILWRGRESTYDATGIGGGFNEREEVEYIKRQSDGEYDDVSFEWNILYSHSSYWN